MHFELKYEIEEYLEERKEIIDRTGKVYEMVKKERFVKQADNLILNLIKYCNRHEAVVLPTPKNLEDEAAIFLEENNISGDTMIELDHNVTDKIKGAVNLHDIMADFARKVR